jgi:hypothetical protein
LRGPIGPPGSKFLRSSGETVYGATTSRAGVCSHPVRSPRVDHVRTSSDHHVRTRAESTSAAATTRARRSGLPVLPGDPCAQVCSAPRRPMRPTPCPPRPFMKPTSRRIRPPTATAPIAAETQSKPSPEPEGSGTATATARGRTRSRRRACRASGGPEWSRPAPTSSRRRLRRGRSLSGLGGVAPGRRN